MALFYSIKKGLVWGDWDARISAYKRGGVVSRILPQKTESG